MATVSTQNNYFQISGDVLFMLTSLKEAAEKEDIFSILLISGKIAQYMATYCPIEVKTKD